MNDMIDMSHFVEAKSDQLNADDLIGSPRTITVRRVTGSDGDQPVSIFYEGDNNKPFKPCKTMRRVLLAVWGRYASDYVGRSMTLYRDDKVTFGGLEVGGIRISHMSHLEKETVVVVMKTKGKKAGIKVLPLAVEKPRARQTADEWARSHIAAIDDAATIEDLDDIERAGVKAMTRLATTDEKLHQRVVDAYNIRRASLAREGEPDADMGEGFADG